MATAMGAPLKPHWNCWVGVVSFSFVGSWKGEGVEGGMGYPDEEPVHEGVEGRADEEHV